MRITVAPLLTLSKVALTLSPSFGLERLALSFTGNDIVMADMPRFSMGPCLRVPCHLLRQPRGSARAVPPKPSRVNGRPLSCVRTSFRVGQAAQLSLRIVRRAYPHSREAVPHAESLGRKRHPDALVFAARSLSLPCRFAHRRESVPVLRGGFFC